MTKKKMATIFRVAPILALIFALGPWAGQAEEFPPGEAQAVEAAQKAAEAKPDKIDVTLSVDILNQYVWRAVAYSRSSAVFQPSLTASYKGFAANIWGNFDTSEKNPFGRVAINRKDPVWNETDFTFSYSREVLPNLTLTAGMIYYLYDHNTSQYDSVEVYGGGGYKLPWFEVGFAAYREVAHLPGWYLQWYVSRSFDLPFAGASLDLWASWSAELSQDKAAYPIPGKNEFYHSLHAGNLMATINFPLGKYFKFSPKIIYWYALGGNSSSVIGGLSWDGRHNHVLGGATISAAF
ncbi:MAG: hypothetical protein AB1491_10240 [Thermodesulfobacteriota bacterium]